MYVQINAYTVLDMVHWEVRRQEAGVLDPRGWPLLQVGEFRLDPWSGEPADFTARVVDAVAGQLRDRDPEAPF